MMKKLLTNDRGFTLVELLLVVSLLALSIGVTGDIVISLIRSYSKTQVANEIEQSANFVALKMEKEIRNGTKIIYPTTNAADSQIYFNDKNNYLICYRLDTTTGVLQRSVNTTAGAVSCTGTYNDLTNNDAIGGVKITCPAGCFARVGSLTQLPSVIKLNIKFEQAGSGTVKAFTGDVVLDNTIVVRGSY